MSPDRGFLSRWSRRKLEAGRGEARADELSDGPESHAGAGLPAGDPAALTAEELAALPRIEDLTAETDLTQFMRAGVPALLRQAALRRVWSLDPAVRDYVGDARDYSYDWNAPGGVPVSGPLMPGDNSEDVIERLFSRNSPDLRGPPESDLDVPNTMAEQDEAADPPGPDEAAAAAPEPDREVQGALELPAGSVPSAGSGQPVPHPAEPVRARRHGTAIPKLD